MKSAFGTALGGALAAAGLHATEAAQVLRQVGELCRKNGECASGICGPKDATGRQSCAAAACLEIGAPFACSSDASCCQDTPAFCVDQDLCLGGSHCCHLAGGSCFNPCDCCNLENCIDNICGGPIG